jgi:hypothetical protein
LNNVQGLDASRYFRLDSQGDSALDTSKKKVVAKPKSRKPATDNGKEGKIGKKPRKTTANKDDATADCAGIKKPRNSRANNVDGEAKEDGVGKEKAPRKSRAKKVQVEADDDTGNEAVVRKPRVKKADQETQAKLPNAQVTKVSTSKREKNRTTKSKIKDATAEDDTFADSLDYGLAEAVKRRTNWTPPPATTKTASFTTPAATDQADSGLASAGSKASEERSKGFLDLFGNFGFSKAEGSATKSIAPDGPGTRKRKLIELVKTNVSTSTTVPKAKAPKKKPRTITEQATSAYAQEDEGSVKPAPLLQYFALTTTEGVTNDGFTIPPRPRSKSPVKTGKGTAQAPILLSPESALKQSGNQDFVFGTSSQLAREESPGFLRDIHAAMQASNEMESDDPFALSPVRLGGKSKALSSMKRNLWSAAARDGAGQLLEVEMVDLADLQAVARHLHTAASSRQPPECRKDNDEPLRDIEGLVEETTATKLVPNTPKRVGPVEAAIRLELLSSPSSGTKSSKSPAESSTQSKVASPKPAAKASGSKNTGASKAKDMEKPDFAAYTMAQLTKEVASYHFKPVKSRDQMIALLEKCWEGKQRLALGTLQSNLPITVPKKPSKSVSALPPSSQGQAASPKRARGRPKKDSSATPSPKRKTKTASVANALSRARKAQKKAEALNEISDSDTAMTPSPPRRHPLQIGTLPLPLQLSSSASIDSRELSPASTQTRLFKYITTAVKNAPLSTDSSNPSWHEKILLYDPIILEDLTIWLNTGALEKAGWDGEVDPREVKKWCESKSICCLWKENLRGGTRSRY